MRGELAIDPESGAPLDPTPLYPYDGKFTRDDDGRYFHDPSSAVSARTPERDEFSDWSPEREGALTTGELKTTATGLFAHFKRSAAAENDRVPERRKAAMLTFKKLRASTDAIDEFVWYAAAERLHQKGWRVRWMRDHMIPRCPFCYSVTKPSAGDLRCASDPNGHGHVTDAIHERVAEVFEATFDDSIDRVTAFDAPGIDQDQDHPDEGDTTHEQTRQDGPANASA